MVGVSTLARSARMGMVAKSPGQNSARMCRVPVRGEADAGGTNYPHDARPVHPDRLGDFGR